MINKTTFFKECASWKEIRQPKLYCWPAQPKLSYIVAHVLVKKGNKIS